MTPDQFRHWLAEMPEDRYQQLKKFYQRINYPDTWEQFLKEIYDEDQQAFPSDHP